MAYYGEDENFDINEALRLGGVPTSEINLFEDALTADIDMIIYESDKAKDLSPVVSGSRVGMSSSHLAAGISTEPGVVLSEDADKIAEQVSKDIIDAALRSTAWEHGPARALEVAASVKGKTVFGGKKKEVQKQVSGKRFKVQFDLDTSQVDKFISEIAGVALFTKEDASGLKSVVYDSTAMEMVRSSVADLLVEEYSVKPTGKSKSKNVGYLTTLARYNQILLISMSRIDYLIDVIINQNISELLLIRSKPEMVGLIKSFLEKIKSGLLQAKGMFEEASMELNRIINKSKSSSMKIDIKIMSSSLITVQNNLTVVLHDTVRFIHDNELNEFLKNLRNSVKYSRYAKEKSKFIFYILRDVVEDIKYDVERFIKIVSGVVDENKRPKEVGLAKTNVNLKSVFVADTISAGNQTNYIFKVADNIDVAFKAMGFNTPMISKLRATLSSSVFNRGDLIGKVDKYVTGKINANIAKAFS